MQSDLSNSLRTIEFFIGKKSAELSIQNVDAFIKDVEGVSSVEVNPSSGQTKITLKDDSLLDKKLIEIQRILFQKGYIIKAKNSEGAQAAIFFGFMTVGFIFVAVVMALFYYFGSLPSFI